MPGIHRSSGVPIPSSPNGTSTNRSRRRGLKTSRESQQQPATCSMTRLVSLLLSTTHECADDRKDHAHNGKDKQENYTSESRTVQFLVSFSVHRGSSSQRHQRCHDQGTLETRSHSGDARLVDADKDSIEDQGDKCNNQREKAPCTCDVDFVTIFLRIVVTHVFSPVTKFVDLRVIAIPRHTSFRFPQPRFCFSVVLVVRPPRSSKSNNAKDNAKGHQACRNTTECLGRTRHCECLRLLCELRSLMHKFWASRRFESTAGNSEGL